LIFDTGIIIPRQAVSGEFLRKSANLVVPLAISLANGPANAIAVEQAVGRHFLEFDVLFLKLPISPGVLEFDIAHRDVLFPAYPDGMR
jgi:hypothetical protein